MKREWFGWGKTRRFMIHESHESSDSWEKGGSNAKGEGRAGKVGGGGTAEVVWGEGGDRGCRRTEIGVSVPAELWGDME